MVLCSSRVFGCTALLALGVVVLVGANSVAAEEVTKSDTTTKSKETIGNPLASWVIEQMVKEINSGLKDRGIEGRFAAFQEYAGYQLDISAGQARTSEVTGNCRLKWYDHLMRNPLKAPVEAEQFTRELHKALRSDATGFDQALAMAREKMDAGHREPQKLPEVTSPEQALDVLKQAMTKAQTAYAAAIAPLSRNEITYLHQYLYPILTGQMTIGHTLWDRSTGRYLCDLLEKMDRRALYDAADALVPLSDPRVLAQLAKIPDKGDIKVEGVSGTVLQTIDTPAGKIVIGGRGNNVYELDKMTGVMRGDRLGRR